MQKIRYSIGLFLLVTLQLLTGCTENSVTPPDVDPDIISYTVSIPSMNRDSIRVSFKINGWRDGDSVRLLAPPMYADNPFIKQTDTNFCNLKITDANDAPLVYTRDSIVQGQCKMLLLAFHKSACPATISYTARLRYDAPGWLSAMPVPNIGVQTGYLAGNFMFLVPYTDKNIAHFWRDGQHLVVNYSLGPDVNLFGSPVTNAEFRNPYQLMFIQLVLISGSALQKQLLFEGQTSGQAFRCVNTSPAKTFSGNVIRQTKAMFTTFIDDIAPRFGTIPESPITIITGLNDGIGMEGMYAFCILDLRENDTIGWMGMTMAHEYIHSWVGVRVGEYDMAWWKEGTAFYLGYLVAKGHNLCSQKLFEDGLVRQDLSVTIGISLSESDRIREKIFVYGTPEGALAYVRGGQVTMILDRAIREATGNKVTILDAIATIVKEKNGLAFYKDYYLSVLSKTAGRDLAPLFTKYDIGTGIIDSSTLWETVNAIGAWGALGDFIPHGK
jgi:hypothetical protein